MNCRELRRIHLCFTVASQQSVVNQMKRCRKILQQTEGMQWSYLERQIWQWQQRRDLEWRKCYNLTTEPEKQTTDKLKRKQKAKRGKTQQSLVWLASSDYLFLKAKQAPHEFLQKLRIKSRKSDKEISEKKYRKHQRN